MEIMAAEVMAGTALAVEPFAAIIGAATELPVATAAATLLLLHSSEMVAVLVSVA